LGVSLAVALGSVLLLSAPLALAAPGMLPTPAPAMREQAPVKGMVTVLDLGSDSCVPCRMMVPVLEEVRAQYKGRAAVVFMDVTKRGDQAQLYRIRAIPTQIFFDKAGREVSRHEGFMDKKTLSGTLDKLLAK
jgi:thioredoxin 1